ncbi:disease resistance protein (TIR-NBS-LRR class) [Thalictrum thalictroides]|uniref:Disease resistance protein (TIR-NBS-LRR class) n=1 Tax=Thalictrum thalictroides TaxID=46969 RepID=A0A7J6WCK3_THATH|nr:disease resistance protein (TIR-NBS-LRR class) [Thalictrum thalictroides]
MALPNVHLDLEAFKKLSDPIPLVIENVVNEIFRVMENLILGAVVFNGWNGIGKERILKYVAKRAMESKSFDVVIWMIERKNVSKLRKFQMRVAEQLGIAFSRNDDSDEDEDEGTMDETVTGRIRACLEGKRFVLLHDGEWGLLDLARMGIPVGRGANYAMVLVASSTSRKYHEDVLMDNLSDEAVWDLVREECVDIADCPNLKGSLITPEVIVECIMCTYYTPFKALANYPMRYWFAEGCIGGVTSDLNTTFGFGQVLLEELDDHCIINKSEGKLQPKIKAITERMVKSNGYSHKVLNIHSVSNFSELSPEDCSKLSTVILYKELQALPENIFDNMINVRILDLSYTQIQSLPPSMVCLVNLRLLNFRSCKCLESFQLSSMGALKTIEILDLSKTPIKEFPDNFFEGLQGLRFLDLSDSSKIFSLPSSLSCLINLELLSLHSCENLSVIPSSIHGLGKLEELDMSGTKLVEIPEQFFQGMHRLKILNLSSNLHLTSIPTSIYNLASLQQLNLQSCKCLRTITPKLGDRSLAIQDLNLSSCPSLENIDQVLSSFSSALPNLRALDLTSVPVSRLSLKGCSSLENITLLSNTSLEKLDLSGTKLKTFPIKGNMNLIQLKRLDAFNMKQVCAVDWKDVKWLPQEVNWDQCGDYSTPHMHIQPAKWRKDGNKDGVFMSVRNANMFRTLKPSSTLWDKSLSCFLVYVCPCEERGKGKTLPLQIATPCYADIFSKIKPIIPNYKRCLEIERVNKLPKGISGVLSHAQYLIVHDESAILRLSDLGIDMNELIECLMLRCNAMKVVFFVGSSDWAEDQPLLRCLEKLQISNLMKLTSMCVVSSQKLENGSFGQLKHLLLEHCPQLVNVFSSSVRLESLEVLQIKFCARLEEIFAGKENEEGSLQRLHTLFLLELPALKNIIQNVCLVSLNEAKIKGCRRLRELPLQSTQNCRLKKNPSIVVTCELELWEQLEWKDNNVKQQITFNSWKPYKSPIRS